MLDPVLLISSKLTSCRESQKTKKAVHFDKDDYGFFGGHISCVVNHLEDNRFAFLAQDITAQKELELERMNRQEELERVVKERTQALEKAMKLKNMFLAVMSHGTTHFSRVTLCSCSTHFHIHSCLLASSV